MEAMHKDFDELKKILTWILNNKSYLSRSSKILPCTWYFKRKIVPNGSLIKCKAWLCVRVDVQKIMVIVRIDIYNLAVLWYRLIIMLIVTCIIDLKMHVIDFIDTFFRAEQNGPPVYMVCFQWVEMDSYEVLLINNNIQGMIES